MKHRLLPNEPFYINIQGTSEESDLTLNLLNALPIKVDYILNLEPITGETGFADASAGDKILFEKFLLFENVDWNDTTPEQDYYINIITDYDPIPVIYDKFSQKILKLAGGTDENDEMVIEVLLAESTDNRLMTDGSGVVFDATLNICSVYEPRDVIPNERQSGQGINIEYSAIHNLRPNVTHIPTEHGLSTLDISFSDILLQMNNLKYYSFRGYILTGEKRYINDNFLIVNLHSGITSDNSYIYSESSTYTYTIEYDDTVDSWVYTCDAIPSLIETNN